MLLWTKYIGLHKIDGKYSFYLLWHIFRCTRAVVDWMTPSTVSPSISSPPEVTRVGRVLAAHADTPPPRQVRLHRHGSSSLLLKFQPVRHHLRHSSSRQQTVVESWSSSTLPEEGCVSATRDTATPRRPQRRTASDGSARRGRRSTAKAQLQLASWYVIICESF